MNKSKYLQVAVKEFWFEKLWTGQKNIEYKECTDFWTNKLNKKEYKYIKLFYGFDKMNVLVYEIKSISIVPGLNTDLNINKDVYAIELGKPLYFIIDGIYTIFDKEFKIKLGKKGIMSSYRRRPQKLLYGKPVKTKYLDNEVYGYCGDENLNKYKEQFKRSIKVNNNNASKGQK